MKQALKVSGILYLCSFVVGFIVAMLFPSFSQAFVEFALKGTVAGAWIMPITQTKNALMIGLSIFLFNFVLGAFTRFVLLPILLYHVAFVFGALTGFLIGFVVGSPASLSHLSDFASAGTMLYTLTIIFENSGYIITCATGYKIGKESQEGLTKKEFLKLLVAPIHLKDARRRQKIERGLSARVPWILLSMVFILLGAISETLLIVYFR